MRLGGKLGCVRGSNGGGIVSLVVLDRPPKTVPVLISSGGIDGTLVTSVKLRVRKPSGVVSEYVIVPSATTTTLVTCVWTLAADGSDLPEVGQYTARAWCYDVGSDLLFDSRDKSFRVESSAVSWPT